MGGSSACRRMLDRQGEVGQHRVCEEVSQADLHSQRLPQPRDGLDRQQRMAAELEEIVVPTHTFELQQLGPDLRQSVSISPSGAS